MSDEEYLKLLKECEIAEKEVVDFLDKMSSERITQGINVIYKREATIPISNESHKALEELMDKAKIKCQPLKDYCQKYKSPFPSILQ